MEVLRLMNKDSWHFINKDDESNPLETLFKILASQRELVMAVYFVPLAIIIIFIHNMRNIAKFHG